MKLQDIVARTIKINESKVYFWTDSTVCLAWLKMLTRILSTFVGNRICKIQEKSNVESWSHIESGLNPADVLSRGMLPKELKNCTLWWEGPSFLKDPESTWPCNTVPEANKDDVSGEIKKGYESLSQHAFLAMDVTLKEGYFPEESKNVIDMSRARDLKQYLKRIIAMK